jgi:hypothetical protein
MLFAPALAATQTAPPRFRLASSTLQLAPGETGGKLPVTVIANLAKQDLGRSTR